MHSTSIEWVGLPLRREVAPVPTVGMSPCPSHTTQTPPSERTLSRPAAITQKVIDPSEVYWPVPVRLAKSSRAVPTTKLRPDTSVKRPVPPE